MDIAGLGNYLVCNLFASLLSLLPGKCKDNESEDFACLLDDCVFSSENSVWHVIGIQSFLLLLLLKKREDIVSCKPENLGK